MRSVLSLGAIVMIGVLAPVMVSVPSAQEFGGIPIGHRALPAFLKEECEAPPGTEPTETLETIATGTIRDFPEMEIRDRAPVGEDVQSSYFRSTETNREFRRGFMEFPIPVFQDKPYRVTLTFAEGPGVIVPGEPPVDHELSWYRADLKVDVEDFDRPTTFLATFEDDMQDANNVWSFDVTDIARGSQGGCLGFRAKLARDPDEAGNGGFGTSIGRYSWSTPHLKFELESSWSFVRPPLNPHTSPAARTACGGDHRH